MTTELDLWNVALARVGDFTISTEAVKIITSATATNPVVVASTAHGYADGDLVLIESMSQMTQVNRRVFRVVVINANSFQLQDENGLAYTAEVTGGTVRRLEAGKHVDNCMLQWPTVRDEVLRAHPWNVASKYVRLARLQAAKTITGITQATEAVVTSAAHGYSSADFVLIESVAGMTELNGRYHTITVLTSSTYKLNGEDSTTYTAYSSGGTSKKALTPLRPDFGYTYRYTLPSDCVRALELADSRANWEAVGTEVFTDDGITVPLRYTFRLIDPARFDGLMASALSSRLALDLAERLASSSSSKKDQLRRDYEDQLDRARGADGQESSPQPFEEDDWLIARHGFTWDRFRYRNWDGGA